MTPSEWGTMGRGMRRQCLIFLIFDEVVDLILILAQGNWGAAIDPRFFFHNQFLSKILFPLHLFPNTACNFPFLIISSVTSFPF